MRSRSWTSALFVAAVVAGCGGGSSSSGTGGTASGGAGAGGSATGGATGGMSSGGAETGGMATGGMSSGGAATGGMATGGMATGGGGAAPAFATECDAEGGLWTLHKGSGGTIDFGVKDPGADDGAVCALVLPGDPMLGPADHVGPGFATEIDSVQSFGYGTYRTRVSLASCSPTEEAVNGIFVYQNDGMDHDGNGLTDNVEIDIEILCGQPNYILLSSWTDYDDATGKFLKWSRGVDTATGDYLESPSDHEYGLVKVGNDPQFKHPGFPAAGAFYEMGFEWHASHLRFFIVLDGQEITLWDFQNQALIPKPPAPFLFNVWHPADHWYEDGAPDYPAKDAVMHLDWLRYWAEAP